MFFALRKDYVLVAGALRGALYNLRDGDVYSIDETALKLLDGCCHQQFNIVDSVSASNANLSKDEATKYLKLLEKMKIGYFCQNPKKRQLLRPKNAKASLLKFLWVELTSSCNLKCLHCYNASGGKRKQSQNVELTMEKWKKVIFDAQKLGCQKIQFTGGEPLIKKKTLRELIIYANYLGYNFIEVFTNAVLLTETDIKFFEKNNVHIAISVYSSQAKIHDEITQIAGSFERTIDSLKKLKDSKIPLRVSVIEMKNNEKSISETLLFLKNDIGIKRIKHDRIRPIGRGSQSKLTPSKNKEVCNPKGQKFEKIRKNKFWSRHDGHNCYINHLCISSRGEVLPCIMERTIKLGNIKKLSLAQIWESSLATNIQKLSKDKIEICKDCEYRYACFDCRARVKQQTGDLYSKPPNCQYDPYIGKWQKNNKEA